MVLMKMASFRQNKGTFKTLWPGKDATMSYASRLLLILTSSSIEKEIHQQIGRLWEGQREVLEQIGIPVFDSRADQDPVDICKAGMKFAELNGYDTGLLDTAGRLHIDEPLMDELARIKAAVDPSEILLVADAMTGQDAVNLAKSFKTRVGVTGIVLTRVDGDGRGVEGRAGSTVVREVGVAEDDDVGRLRRSDGVNRWRRQGSKKIGRRSPRQGIPRSVLRPLRRALHSRRA